MQVKLLHNTPLFVASTAIRKCWASEGKSDTEYKYVEELYGNTTENFEAALQIMDQSLGGKDRALIDRVGNKNSHSSTLEHLNYSFDVAGISRACLQEVARHRIGSFSVKSSRYTLKELKDTEPFFLDGKGKFDVEAVEKFVRLTGNPSVDEAIVIALTNLRTAIKNGTGNDIAKYALPEAFLTSLVWTINLRSLGNFLKLRLNKAALWEIQDLACLMVRAMPKDHLYLIEDIVKEAVSGNKRIESILEVFT